MQLPVGTKIYVLLDGLKLLRTINYSSSTIFEWKWGWDFIYNIKPNPNKKSKIKYILNN
jgi:hypothetical protein